MEVGVGLSGSVQHLVGVEGVQYGGWSRAQGLCNIWLVLRGYNMEVGVGLSGSVQHLVGVEGVQYGGWSRALRVCATFGWC